MVAGASGHVLHENLEFFVPFLEMENVDAVTVAGFWCGRKYLCHNNFVNGYAPMFAVHINLTRLFGVIGHAFSRNKVTLPQHFVPINPSV